MEAVIWSAPKLVMPELLTRVMPVPLVAFLLTTVAAKATVEVEF
ncbi:MAG: hypothetical protein ACRD9R_03300 [Pyrinomonadaceae bacterium]